MTALSDLLNDSKVATARAIERIAGSEKHSMNKAAVYRYVAGSHPDHPKEKYLQALAYGFEIPITKVRAAALAAPGELGPWTPPLESGQLSRPVREALDALIVTLAKEGFGDAAHAAKKIDDEDEGGGSVTPLIPKKPAPAAPAKRAARKTTDPRKPNR